MDDFDAAAAALNRGDYLTAVGLYRKAIVVWDDTGIRHMNCLWAHACLATCYEQVNDFLAQLAIADKAIGIIDSGNNGTDECVLPVRYSCEREGGNALAHLG